MILTKFDLRRLDLYSRNMVDYHLIMDLLPEGTYCVSTTASPLLHLHDFVSTTASSLLHSLFGLSIK